MDTSQLAYVLDELQFSAEMPREALNQLAEASTVRELAAGGVLFREGSENANLFLIKSGRIALEMNIPGRGATRILTLGPGEMVGWSALLGKGKMTAAAVAVEDTQLIVAPADKLRAISQQNREFGYVLMQRMANALSRRLVATRLQLLDLFADDPSPIPTT